VPRKLRTFCWRERSTDDLPRLRLFDGLSDIDRSFSRIASWVGTSGSERRRISRSGDDIGSAHRGSIVIDPTVSKPFCGACCWPRQGSPAQRKVANRASLTDVGAHAFALEAEDAEEIDDAREDRDELSETMDSGDDDEEPEMD